MLTTRHAVDFAYSGQELDAVFHYAHAHRIGGAYGFFLKAP
jgi:hypothetical protein